MRKRWVLVGIVFLLASWLLAGCGIAQEEYDAIVAQLSNTQEELQSVKAEYDKLTGERQDLPTEKTSLMEEKETLETAYDKLSTQYENLQAEKASLLEEKESLQADYGKLKTENTAIMGELAEIKESHGSVSQELSTLKAVYPPKHFHTRQELRSWIGANAISDTPIHHNLLTTYKAYERALEIQEAALRDGFIIDVAMGKYLEGRSNSSTWVYLLAGIDDGVYWWFPDRDNIELIVKIVATDDIIAFK